MKSQENEISKNMKSPKKQMKSEKKKEIKKISKFRNFRAQSMSVSDNISVRQCQHLVNVRVR